MKPKVSIIVPVFNMERYVGRCLDSILGQTLKEIEVIVVNDASTDKSREIIAAYAEADTRVVALDHDENKGLLLARQTGVRNAVGEFIGHVDSDDVVDPLMYEEMYARARDGHLDIVQCGMVRVKDGEELEYGSLAEGVLVGDEILKALLSYQLPHSHCSKLVRRSLWVENLSLFPSDGRLKAEDFLPVAIMCFRAKRLEVHPKPFYKYTLRAGSGSQIKSEFAVTKRAFSLAHNIAKLREFLVREGSIDRFEDELNHTEKVFYRSKAMRELFTLPVESSINFVRKIVNFNGWAPLVVWTVPALTRETRLRELTSFYKLQDRIQSEIKVLVTVSSPAADDLVSIRPLVAAAAELAGVCRYNFVFVLEDEGPADPDWEIPEGVDIIARAGRELSVESIVDRVEPDLLVVDVLSGFSEALIGAARSKGTPLIAQELTDPDDTVRHIALSDGISEEAAARKRVAMMSLAAMIRLRNPASVESLPSFLHADVRSFTDPFPPALKVAGAVSGSHGRKRLLYVADTSSGDELFRFLEAFASLKDECERWDLLIFGGNKDQQKIVDFLEEHDIRGRVEWRFGARWSCSVYEKCHLHVTTALDVEGVPALCESMAHAVPSIGFECCPGVARYVRHNVNGILVSPANPSDGLMAAMHRLMVDDDLRAAFGACAQADSEAFLSLGACAEWQELFESARKNSGDTDRKLLDRFLVAPEEMESSLELCGVDLPERLTARKKSILLFSLRNYDSIGGVQLSTTRLANHLHETGYRVALVPHKKIDRTSLFYPLHEGVQFECMAIGPTPKNLPEYQVELQRVIDLFKPDAVAVLATGYINLYISMLLSSTDIPVLTTERGEPDFLNLAKGFGNRVTDFLFADKVHLLFDRYRKRMGVDLAERIRVIPSPVSFPEEPVASPSSPRAEDGRFKILYCGRVDYEKDLFTLIRAFELIFRKYPDWDLEIIGSGPQLDDVKDSVIRPAKRRVHFSGGVSYDEVANYYRSANIFAFPSLTEGCPLALREAMSYRLPVIGFSDAGGVCEVLSDGGGVLIDQISQDELNARAEILSTSNNHGQMPHSKAVKMAFELERLIDNPELRDSMGLEAGAIVREKYSAERIHRMWVDVFEELISSGKNKYAYPERFGKLVGLDLPQLKSTASKAPVKQAPDTAAVAALRAELLAAKEEAAVMRNRYRVVNESKTYRIGTLVRLAIVQPGFRTLTLPIDIMRVAFGPTS